MNIVHRCFPAQDADATNRRRGAGRRGADRSARISLSYLRSLAFPIRPEQNLEDFFINRFGRELYDTFFRDYTEKVWGIPCTEIRAEWAAQRIQGLSLAQAVRSAASLNRRSTDIKTLIHSFRYPRLGPGQMWEAARDRIVELGGEVRVNSSKTDFLSSYLDQPRNPDGTVSSTEPLRQRDELDETRTDVTAQADVIRPFGARGKFEFGYKGVLRELDNGFSASRFSSCSRASVSTSAVTAACRSRSSTEENMDAAVPMAQRSSPSIFSATASASTLNSPLAMAARRI